MVIAVPGIERQSIQMNSTSCNFVVMACDGVWDVMNNKQVAHFVSTRLQKQQSQSKISLIAIARELCEHCAIDQKSTDNISVVIVLFH